jgi:hypothetical protein
LAFSIIAKYVSTAYLSNLQSSSFQLPLLRSLRQADLGASG